MKYTKKLINILMSSLLIIMNLGVNTITLKAANKEEETKNVLYYNDFKNHSGRWDSFKGKIDYTVENESLIVENKEADSILINKDDVIRNSGDVELTFTYNEGDRCFGPTFRADPTDQSKWQSVIFAGNQSGKSKWILGHPNGGWKNIESDIELKNGVQYRLLVRYADKKISVYLNGEEIFDDDLVFDNGDMINSEWSGQTGIRKHCDRKKVVIDKFVSGPYNSIPITGFGDMYSNDFKNSVGNWGQYKGQMTISHEEEKLHLKNETQESLIINLDDKVRDSGDIQLDFTYSNQSRCFGPIFRADNENKSNWQAFAYMGNEANKSKWSLGQPGGKWINFTAGPALKEGEAYKLVLRYNDKKIKAYLNGEEIFNDEVIYGEDKGMIDGHWVGQTGIRKFCVSQELIFDRIISADHNTIPQEGFMKIITPSIDSDQPGKPTEPVEPVEPEENLEQYAIMREKWREQKVGNFTDDDLKDKEISNYLENLNEDAKKLVKSMDLSENRDTLWKKRSSDTVSANITTQFKNMSVLARAYGTYGSDYYQNEALLENIKSGLEFLTGPKWYDGKKLTGNWWDWQIGIAQEFVDILMIIHKDLSQEDVKKYSEIIRSYVPNANKQINGSRQGSYISISFGTTATGANRTDLALTSLATGILLENEAIVEKIVPSIEPVFKIVNTGDGFYSDGSFIQHNDIPYTGSYGNVLVKGVGKILSILDGSPWQMDDKKIENFSSLVYQSFIPIIYKGETMPMFGGRSISRAPSPRKQGFGSATIYNLLIVSNFASEPYKTKLKEAAKYWIKEDTSDYYYNNNRDLRDLLEVKEVMNDDSIKGESVPFTGSKIYGAADRFVHTSQNFSLGISMHSNRISAFESGNNENKKGWFTSDGMIYLQNKDIQFGESYWPTVDWYRLPGTTVDTRELEETKSGFQRNRSNEAWVGGSSSGINSAVGMRLNKNNFKNNNKIVGYDLSANKSWFVVGDMVVSLGSNINGTSPASIETVVENRLLDKNMNYELISNIDIEETGRATVNKGDWIMLKSSTDENNLAYLFLGEHKIKLLKEKRSGKYSDINEAFINDKTYQENYQKIIIEHGKEPKDDNYSYILIPSVSEETIKNLKMDNFKVLRNDDKVQALEYDGIVLSNIWDSNGGKVKEISSNGAASLVMEETETELTFYISNPKHDNKKISIDIDRDDLILVDADETIEMIGELNKSSDIKFEVDTTNSLGKTHRIKFKKKIDTSELLFQVGKYRKVEVDKLTEYSYNLYNQLLQQAEEILESEDVSQSVIDELAIAMDQNYDSLEFKLQLTKAKKVIAEYESLNEDDYTSESYNLLTKAINKLKDVLSKYDETKPLNVSQIDIDSQVESSINAMLSLSLTVDEEKELDFSKFDNLMDHYEKLNSSEYTEISWKQLESSVEEVLQLIKEDITQEDLDVMSQKVLQSMLELEYKDGDSVVEEEDSQLDGDSTDQDGDDGEGSQLDGDSTDQAGDDGEGSQLDGDSTDQDGDDGEGSQFGGDSTDQDADDGEDGQLADNSRDQSRDKEPSESSESNKGNLPTTGKNILNKVVFVGLILIVLGATILSVKVAKIKFNE